MEMVDILIQTITRTTQRLQYVFK